MMRILMGFHCLTIILLYLTTILSLFEIDIPLVEYVDDIRRIGTADVRYGPYTPLPVCCRPRVTLPPVDKRNTTTYPPSRPLQPARQLLP